MNYSNGRISRFFFGPYRIELHPRSLFIKTPFDEEVSYTDIHQVEVKTGILWATVLISGPRAERKFRGIAKTQAQELKDQICLHAARFLHSIVDDDAPTIESLMAVLSDLTNSRRYLSRKDVDRQLSAFEHLNIQIEHPLFSYSQVNRRYRSALTTLDDLKKPDSQLLKQLNEEHMRWALRIYKHLFDNIERNPLTEEQRLAAIVDEDNGLIIAAAGSGKSSTIVAKVMYLIESGLAIPDEILVLTFNNLAQKEIDERLKRAIMKSSGHTRTVTARTFHSFGLHVFSTVNMYKPSITKYAAASRRRQSQLFDRLVESTCVNDPSFRELWTQYLTLVKYPCPSPFSFNTIEEYNDFREQSCSTRSKRDSMHFATYDGREVKSIEELRIANFLILNGVQFEYEKPYVYNTATAAYRQYQPDFYYPEADLYHEHFALNENGEIPSHFNASYLKGISWKRRLHDMHNTALIETYSYNFNRGDIFETLKKKLREAGVTFKPLAKREVDEIIKRTYDSTRDLELFISFIQHLKSNRLTVEKLRLRSRELDDQFRVQLFLTVVGIIYQRYQEELSIENEIDFQDQINLATECIEKDYFQHGFKYILVDEFQDISQDRKRLLQAMLAQREHTKFFAVGDDWQSIYRFTGSDINVMTKFQQHFGEHHTGRLNMTFRSGQSLVDISSKFIQANPLQLRKDVTSSWRQNPPKQVCIYEYRNRDQKHDHINNILEALNDHARSGREPTTVCFLGRYQRSGPTNLSTLQAKFSKLTIDFNTIHASKGLERDFVIIVDVESGIMGFPSLLQDDPLLQMVLPAGDAYPNAEERRLMYVALTRAKQATYLLASTKHPSVFYRQLKDDQRVSVYGPSKTNPCPTCEDGELIQRQGRSGIFWGCDNYPRCTFTAQGRTDI